MLIRHGDVVGKLGARNTEKRRQSLEKSVRDIGIVEVLNTLSGYSIKNYT